MDANAEKTPVGEDKSKSLLLNLIKEEGDKISFCASYFADPLRLKGLEDKLADTGLDNVIVGWRSNRDNLDPASISVEGMNGYFSGMVDTLIAHNTPNEQRETEVGKRVELGISLLTDEITLSERLLDGPIPGDVFRMGWVEEKGYRQSNPEIVAVAHNLPVLVVEKLTRMDRDQEQATPIHEHKMEVLVAVLGLARVIVENAMFGKVEEKVQKIRVDQTQEHILKLFRDGGQNEIVTRLLGQKSTALLEYFKRNPVN